MAKRGPKPKEKRSGIYCIERIENEQKYIGQGGDVEDRMWQSHRECKYLRPSLIKYGENAFRRYVIEYCPINELEEREKYWIKELHSHVSEGGYNISWGGNAPFRNLHHSEESKKLISLAVSGENHPLWKTHQSEESKKKNRESQLGEKNRFFGTKRPNAKSKYHGVRKLFIDKKYTYWEARTKIHGKETYIGFYKTEIEAAIGYDKYIADNNFPNPLNFPERLINGVYNDK